MASFYPSFRVHRGFYVFNYHLYKVPDLHIVLVFSILAIGKPALLRIVLLFKKQGET